MQYLNLPRLAQEVTYVTFIRHNDSESFFLIPKGFGAPL